MNVPRDGVVIFWTPDLEGYIHSKEAKRGKRVLASRNGFSFTSDWLSGTRFLKTTCQILLICNLTIIDNLND